MNTSLVAMHLIPGTVCILIHSISQACETHNCENITDSIKITVNVYPDA